MRPLVFNGVGFLVKDLPVFIALRFLTLMSPWMHKAGLTTANSFTKCLSKVCFLMSNKVIGTLKGFCTFTTYKWFLGCVSSLVFNQSRLLDEGFPTFTALIGLLSSMDDMVANESRAVTEGFPTFVTFVGFLSSMNSLV